MTLRIVFDHQIFSLQRYGGVSRYFFELANALPTRNGTEVQIACPFYVTEYFRRDSPVRPSGLRLYPFPKTTKLRSALNELVNRARSRGKADVVHETYYQARSIGYRGVPRVLTVFDMIHERFPEHFSAADLTSADKRCAVQRADAIICISESTKRDLIEFLDTPPEKVHVVHLGISGLRGDPKAPRPLPQPYLLYVGARWKHKNFERFLEACAAPFASDRDLRLACFGGGRFTPHELELATRLGIERRMVHFDGTDSTLAALYRNAVALVFPSLYEGFGLPPLEAMASGCPVAASSSSSIPEVVGDAALLFDPLDAASMEQAIGAIATSTQLRDVLVARGKERARQFSWQRCADATLQVYNGLIAGS